MAKHAAVRRHSRVAVALAAVLAAGAAGFGLHYGLSTPEAAAAGDVVVSSTADLQSAFKNATAGDVIRVRAGTYRPTASLQSKASGTASNPITVTAYGDGTVTIDGSNLPSGKWIMDVQGSYWRVSNLTLTKGPAHGLVVTSSTGGVFRNLVTSHNGNSGFTLRGDRTVDNLVENLDSFRNYDAENNGENADGIAVKHGSGTGNVIRGARLYENADDGLDFWAFSDPVRIERSWAWGNGYDRWNDPDWQGDGNGFKLGGGGEVVAHLVTQSAAWSNAGNGFTENSNSGAITMHRNTAYKNDKAGFFFRDSNSRMSRNLSTGNQGNQVAKGGRVISAANSWDAGVTVPSFASADASQATKARQADGRLPTVTFLVTGTDAIGASMRG
jgi:hypothetical protein